MNTLKKTIITLFVSSLLAMSGMAYAEETSAALQQSIADTIKHIEEGKAKAAVSDFSAATIHLKAARNSAAGISEHALEVHKGVSDINDGMKAVKLGHPEQAVEKLDAAIKIFKAL